MAFDQRRSAPVEVAQGREGRLAPAHLAINAPHARLLPINDRKNSESG